MVNEIFSGTLRNAEVALDVRGVKQNLLASNVANAGTPGYRALDVDFAATMADAIGQLDDSGRAIEPSDALRDALHVTGADGPTIGNSHNTVNMEDQMARLEKNGLMYQVTTQLVAAKLQGLRNAITEGGRQQ